MSKSMLLRLQGSDLTVFTKLQSIFNLKTSNNIGPFKRLFMLLRPVINDIDTCDTIEIVIRDEVGQIKKRTNTSIGVLCELEKDKEDGTE